MRKNTQAEGSGLNHAMNESMGGAAYLRNGVRRRRGGCTGVVLCGGSSGWVGGVTSPDIFLGCSKAVEYVHFIGMYQMTLKQD